MGFDTIEINLVCDLSGLAKKYCALHLGDYSDEELLKASTESERIQGMIIV